MIEKTKDQGPLPRTVERLVADTDPVDGGVDRAVDRRRTAGVGGDR